MNPSLSKSPARPSARMRRLGTAASMAFSGTLVTTGTGRGVVVATGAKTQIGQISDMLVSVEGLRTPLVVQMDRFARWLHHSHPADLGRDAGLRAFLSGISTLTSCSCPSSASRLRRCPKPCRRS